MEFAHLLVFVALLAAATVTDLRFQKIPNVITFSGCLAGTVLTACISESVFQSIALYSIPGIALALFLFLPVHAFAKFGAGDVKLLAMVGAFIGPFGVLWASAFTLIAGGLLALVWVLMALGPREFVYKAVGLFSLLQVNGSGSLKSSTGSVMKEDMPYAAAIGVGAVAGYLMVT